jgi:hypothetical protein
VQVPPALLDDPAALASFIDFRLLVRLATAENQMLTLGRNGLLETPGIRRLPAGPDPVSSLLSACDHVELMGGSADGVVMSTTDYYRYLAPRHDVVASLSALGSESRGPGWFRPARRSSATLRGATIYDTAAGRRSARGGRPKGRLPRRACPPARSARHSRFTLLTHFFVASRSEPRSSMTTPASRSSPSPAGGSTSSATCSTRWMASRRELHFL